MGSPVEDDLANLYKYALGCKFIIETGGGGKSTHFLAKAAIESQAKMVTIEADSNRTRPVEGVESMTGWSVTYEDITKPSDRRFAESRYKTIDRKVAHCRWGWLANLLYMHGEKDLIRKVFDKYCDLELDFFFCDTGEYCGIAEWDIVKDKIKVGGCFAAHDIYYPKSIKCYQVIDEIEQSNDWDVLLKTQSLQGLLIARRLK
jgi:hypothetical protein